MDFKPSRKLQFSILLLLCATIQSVLAEAVDFRFLDKYQPEVTRKATLNDYNAAFQGMSKLLASKILLRQDDDEYATKTE